MPVQQKNHCNDSGFFVVSAWKFQSIASEAVAKDQWMHTSGKSPVINLLPERIKYGIGH